MLSNKSISKRELLLLAFAAVVGIIVMPCLNAFVPPSSFFHVSNFSINIYGKYLCYAVLAIGVNLLWCYTGLLSLCQALLFSLGGLCACILLLFLLGQVCT